MLGSWASMILTYRHIGTSSCLRSFAIAATISNDPRRASLRTERAENTRRGDRLVPLSRCDVLDTSTTANGAVGFTRLILKRLFFRQKSKLHSTMSRLLLVSSRCIVVVFWSAACWPLFRTRLNAARNCVFMPT
uniref:Uncharacterized protein n=1 Tax=Anopheles merus TaxID=30066 RepID=A0A182VM66_ANOME